MLTRRSLFGFLAAAPALRSTAVAAAPIVISSNMTWTWPDGFGARGAVEHSVLWGSIGQGDCPMVIRDCTFA